MRPFIFNVIKTNERNKIESDISPRWRVVSVVTIGHKIFPLYMILNFPKNLNKVWMVGLGEFFEKWPKISEILYKWFGWASPSNETKKVLEFFTPTQNAIFWYLKNPTPKFREILPVNSKFYVLSDTLFEKCLKWLIRGF